MNIPFQVRVPVEAALKINTKLGQLQRSLGKGKGSECKASLTPANLIRLAVLIGLESLLALSTEDLIGRLNDDGVARGRPRHVA